MTGWRIGWLLVPRRPGGGDRRAGRQPGDLPAGACPVRGTGRLRCLRRMRRPRHPVRRATGGLLLNGLRRLGIDRLAPADGAFYVYADISHLTDDSAAFCARLLDRPGIAAAPGVDFDQVDGHRFMRFSFAGSTEAISGALAALEEFLAPADCRSRPRSCAIDRRVNPPAIGRRRPARRFRALAHLDPCSDACHVEHRGPHAGDQLPVLDSLESHGQSLIMRSLMAATVPCGRSTRSGGRPQAPARAGVRALGNAATVRHVEQMASKAPGTGGNPDPEIRVHT